MQAGSNPHLTCTCHPEARLLRRKTYAHNEKGRLASRPQIFKNPYSIFALSTWIESPFTEPVAAM